MSRPLFSILGIPVTISPWHLLWMLLLVPPRGNDLAMGLALIVVASLSVLAHEMGHALTSRALGLEPEVYLVSLGGYTRHLPAKRPRDEFLIVAAGPTMNFLLALGAFLLTQSDNARLVSLASNAMLINVVWGIYNLLPVWPMDGGQMLRIVLLRLLSRVRAERWTHRVGIGLGTLLALYLIFGLHWTFAGVFLVMSVIQNWQMLRTVEESPDAKAQGPHGRVRELLDLARQAYARDEYAETLRYTHQARSEPYLSNVEMQQVWQFLALASARLGEYEDAVRYAERVPQLPDMALIQAHALARIGDAARIRRFLSTPAALMLPHERVAELQELARESAPLT